MQLSTIGVLAMSMIDLQDKPQMVERAFLVGVHRRDQPAAEIDDLLAELRELVNTMGVGIVGSQRIEVRQWQARLLMGTGKAQELLDAARAVDADCIIFDNEITPAQQRNWEEFSELCVIDRQEVILDIFAARAQTREAKLQVDLARTEYNLPRLQSAWSHLGRQGGGSGGGGGGGGGGGANRGEGEQQIEVDRRIVRRKISTLKEELAAVRKHRATQRKDRVRTPMAHAAVVGYTNAGKSSLVTALSGSEVYVDNKLFATLDITTRRIRLPNGLPLLITDTVGFVRNLPHRLVEAFKATLEEAVLADFLLHIIDVGAGQIDAFHATTMDVLRELGAENKRMLIVFNKVDTLAPDDPKLAELAERYPDALFVSAHSRQGLDQLEARMTELLGDQVEQVKLLIPYDRTDIVAMLHEQAQVDSTEYLDNGISIQATLAHRLAETCRPWQPDAPSEKEIWED
jgi:GTP-binding protein HflX